MKVFPAGLLPGVILCGARADGDCNIPTRTGLGEVLLEWEPRNHRAAAGRWGGEMSKKVLISCELLLHVHPCLQQRLSWWRRRLYEATSLPRAAAQAAQKRPRSLLLTSFLPRLLAEPEKGVCRLNPCCPLPRRRSSPARDEVLCGAQKIKVPVKETRFVSSPGEPSVCFPRKRFAWEFSHFPGRGSFGGGFSPGGGQGPRATF